MAAGSDSYGKHSPHSAGHVAPQNPGIGLLSLFVFICSFIPIAGVFISTAPIAFVAVTEYGFLQVQNAMALLGLFC